MRTTVIAIVLAVVALPAILAAQPVPPAPGVDLPQAYYDRIAEDPTAFQFQKAWIEKARRAKTAREAFLATHAGGPQPLSMASLPETVRRQLTVAGTVRVPVIMVQFSNVSSSFTTADMQKQLFDGPTTSDGTLTELYDEMSYGQLTMLGDVHGVVTSTLTDLQAEGGCNGLCSAAKTGQLILEALQGVDGSVNFGLYDNDGPDGLPNSGDDDGFVDFIAIVHPEKGGECGTSNMWSHRWVVAGWPEFGGPWTSNDARSGGGFIQVWDYTIQPAIGSGTGCQNGIIEIGVFGHEFGHAFGLPDLYDTDGGGSGIGEHGLMGSGNWQTPPNPVHMCAWSKAELGWVIPTEVGPVAQANNVPDAETHATSFQLNIMEEKFNRKTFQPINGAASMHCGLPTGAAGARNWASGAGYGNGWREEVCHDFTWDGTTPVTVEYNVSYDCEPGYDFGYMMLVVNGVETTLGTYTGKSPTPVPESIDISSFLMGSGASGYQLVARFTSDVAWSDEDGNYNSLINGPFKFDDVTVTGGGENYTTGFETNEDGWYYDFAKTPNREVFLVENRNRSTGQFDNDLNAEGLLIWHVEQNVAHSALGNTSGGGGTTNLKPAGVVLEEADGLRELLLTSNRGNAGDSWPGSTIKTTFDNASTPNSKSYNAFATNVAVTNISAAGATMTATMQAGRFPPTVASITPVVGDGGTVVAITDVSGDFFAHGSTFLIRQDGAAASGPRAPLAVERLAQNVEWVGKTKLTGELDLTGVPQGTYDVVVVGPDGQEGTLPLAFAVPVFVQAFGGTMGPNGAELTWDIHADEPFRGFRVMRRQGSGPELDVHPQGLLDAALRSYVDGTVEPGVDCEYALVVVLSDGSELRSQRVQLSALRFVLELRQNFPNPFNPTTTIRYSLAEAGHVRLAIYDVQGRRVASLVDEAKSAGPHEVVWSGTSDAGAAVASGVYFYRLETGRMLLTKKLLLLK